MSDVPSPLQLDVREKLFSIDSPHAGLKLFLRLLESPTPAIGGRRPVLYLHGATFPSALSIAHRFDGRSWRDELCDGGFDVWGLDFHGFGGSDRYPEMNEPADAHEPLCLAKDAAGQAETAADFILSYHGLTSLSLITHSWGSMAAGIFAARHPTRVDKIVMFAPLTQREAPRYEPRPNAPAWRIVTVEDQWARFIEDVPKTEPPVLSKDHFNEWAEAWLDSDPGARLRQPMGVKTPTGPLVEILRAWHGELAWEPERVQAPVAIIRGAWDGLVTDADAHWLFERLSRSPERRDIKIARGTHLMHLEEMRFALWRESVAFLLGNDPAPHGEQWRVLASKSPSNKFKRFYIVFSS